MIKAHVKEGVEMARKEKLPRVIIDVIRQHHGTTLIQYFYYPANARAKVKQDGTLQPFPEKANVKGKKKTTVAHAETRQREATMVGGPCRSTLGKRP